ncbi:MAG: hypothetical protein ACKPJJ_30730, partial [Planctomycetaceae bacterium]
CGLETAFPREVMMRILLLLAWLSACCGSADAGVLNFTGPFAVANWTQTVTNGGDGSFNLTNAPLSVTLIGSDHGSNNPSDTRFSITPTTGWFINFDWQYSTQDLNPSWDPAGYSVNGVFTELTDPVGSNTQFGQVRDLLIQSGDTFAFEQRSGDSIFGRGVLTLSTFSAFAAVPEPAGIIPVAVGFAAFGLRAFRRRRAVQAG